jgi:hypothetical protein
MTTSATSRRAFLAGSAVAVGGLATAGRLVLAVAGRPGGSIRDLGLGHSSAAAGQTMGFYLRDLPRPPGDTGRTGFELDGPVS